MKTLWIYALILLSSIGMVVSQYLIYIYAPIEKNLGIVQKIFYIHMPLAWWSLTSFLVVCIASILYLKTRCIYWDNIASAAAEVGVVLSTFAIITGAIWGRYAWGIWWTWDPRLTTAFILWFLYTAYLLLRNITTSQERRAFISSVIGILAFIDVPLVFLSARLWRSIHPTVFANENSSLDSEMKLTIILCTLFFGFFWLCLIVIRSRQNIQKNLLTNFTFNKFNNGELS